VKGRANLGPHQRRRDELLTAERSEAIR
jgi:hypothetical protein